MFCKQLKPLLEEIRDQHFYLFYLLSLNCVWLETVVRPLWVELCPFYLLYFYELNSELQWRWCGPQDLCMKLKLYSLWVHTFIFVQLAWALWNMLDVFGQLNNVNLKPINILLWFEWRKTFSTLNKHGERRLFSVEEMSFFNISSVKS